MGILRVLKGKTAVVVWKRGTWLSMPHLEGADVNGELWTRCGRSIVDSQGVLPGITAYARTGMDNTLWVAMGCGLCRRVEMLSLRDSLTREDMRATVRELLTGAKWVEVEESHDAG